MDKLVAITFIICSTLVAIILIVRAARLKLDATFDGDIDANAKAKLPDATEFEAKLKSRRRSR